MPNLLRGQATADAGPKPGPSGFTFYNVNNSAQWAAYAERDRQRRADQARQEAPERAEVVARYGSVKAVLAWTKPEKLLRAAVAQWSVFQTPPYQRWTLSIDDHQRESLSGPSARVIHALSTAYPLPATITEAAAEYAMWEQRNRDLGLVLEDTSDCQLDLPAYLRRDLVCRLVETELRAASLAEVPIRQRHLVNSEVIEPDIERAVLRDLESLVKAETGQVAASRGN